MHTTKYPAKINLVGALWLTILTLLLLLFFSDFNRLYTESDSRDQIQSLKCDTRSLQSRNTALEKKNQRDQQTIQALRARLQHCESPPGAENPAGTERAKNPRTSEIRSGLLH